MLDDADRVPALIETARALGVTDLFVQVYRGGRAWFETTLADDGPWIAAIAGGRPDPLTVLIDAAHASDIRVHAWVNVVSLSSNGDAKLIDVLGRDAVLVDRAGRSVLDYPDHELPMPDRRWLRMGTPGVYLDPSLPRVRERLVAIFADLVTRHPRLDGLHLDYIRHPGVLPFAPGSRFGVGLDFGYGEESRALFMAETGLPDPWVPGAAGEPATIRNANSWDRWRREKVGRLVAEIAAETRKRRPGLVLSAAVIAYVDRAYLSLAQDWRTWLRNDWIDLAVPMAYTTDDVLLRHWAEQFAGHPLHERIWTGLGSWLFAQSPEKGVRQIEIAREAGCAGIALFSYDAIADAPALEAALAAEHSAEDVVD